MGHLFPWPWEYMCPCGPLLFGRAGPEPSTRKCVSLCLGLGLGHKGEGAAPQAPHQREQKCTRNKTQQGGTKKEAPAPLATLPEPMCKSRHNRPRSIVPRVPYWLNRPDDQTHFGAHLDNQARVIPNTSAKW
eukprot:gene8724-biopygen7646